MNTNLEQLSLDELSRRVWGGAFKESPQYQAMMESIKGGRSPTSAAIDLCERLRNQGSFDRIPIYDPILPPYQSAFYD